MASAQQNRRSAWRIVLTFVAMACPTVGTRADDVADFYRGKQVTMIVGFSAGNAFDVYGRAVARYLGRYLPGNPTVIVQNMPGAGGLKSANYLYNVAPKDGSVVGIFSRSNPMEPLLGDADARFDPTRFAWIGSAGNEVSVCVSRSASAIKTWDDVMTKPFVVAASSLSADTGVFANVLKNEFGAKIRIVSGYPGGGEMSQAIERGEVDGRCGWSWSAIKSSKPSWVRDGVINVLLQLGLQGSDELKGIPLVTDLAKTERQRQIVRLVFARQQFAWPFVAPPDTPDDRRDAIRSAFMSTLKDPEFLAEGQHLALEINPVSGEAVAQLIREAYATPKPVIDDVRALLATK
jgi:tripartite-type tricarboxylate transporter receptor subunit TctC